MYIHVETSNQKLLFGFCVDKKMSELVQVIAGPERSMVLGPAGAFVWGNVRSVRVLPEGIDGASVCIADPTEIGHLRFSQDVPQRLNPHGMDWEGVGDMSGQLIAWAEGKVHRFAPQVVRDHGAAYVGPVELPGAVRHVWTGEHVAFAALEDGRLFAWGDTGYGRLGIGEQALGAGPTPVVVDGVVDIRQLSSGAAHTVALDGRGRLWVWGANASGQLGQGDLREQARPKQVRLPELIKAMAAGATHTLALDAKGQLWGWGSNHKKQLSAQIAEAYVAAPVRIGGKASGLKSLSAGMHFSAALTHAGQVRTWGWNGLGQLGRADAAEQGEQVVAVPRIRQISAGRSHVLALTADGACWAWGDNRFGACQGEAEMRAMPHQVELSAMKSAQQESPVLAKELV